MKEKTFLILVIISLILINVFIIIRFYYFKHHEIANEAIYNNTVFNGNDELHSYMLNFSTSILNSNLQLDGIMIKDTLDEIIPLTEAFNRGQKHILVCRFSKTHCESCVNFSIQKVRACVDSIGKDNVMFLGNYRNNRVFNKIIPLYGIEGLKVYNTSSLNIPVEELCYPYYFVLDESLRISNVFVPDKATPHISNNYLRNIQKVFNLK